MIAILVGLIALGLFSAAMFWFAINTRSTGAELWALIAGVFSSLFTCAGFATWCVSSVLWFGAGHKARIINETFGTHYTQAEVFWAEDVIDEVRELKRKRIELNGDLFRDEKP